MKKKIIYGLLFAVAMVTASSSFVSCKDYEGDDYAHWQQEIANGTINQNSTLNDLIQFQLNTLKFELGNALGNGTGNDAAIQALLNTVNGFTYDSNGSTYDLLQALSTLNGYTTQAIGLGVNSSLANIRFAWGDSLKKAYDSAYRARDLAYEDSIRIKNLTDSLSEYMMSKDSANLSMRIDTLSQLANSLYEDAKATADSALKIAYDTIINKYIQDIYSKLKVGTQSNDSLKDSIEAVKDSLQDKVGAINVTLGQIEDAYQDADSVLAAKLDSICNVCQDLRNDLDSVADEVTKIKDAMAKEVTGIEIQGTYNDIFGYFALPVGIQSNVLAAYYGQFDAPVVFPVGDGDEAALWVGGVAKATKSELPTIKGEKFSQGAGLVIDEAEGNAGTLYVTVNPSNVDFTGKVFTLNTTDNKQSVVSLGELKASEKRLMWGFTRGASANGFYEASATMKASDVANSALKFDLASVKNALKNVINNWREPSKIDKSALANAVYKNMQQSLPRFGVQATWKDELTGEDKTYASKYDISAFSFKPLGFDFLYGSDFSTYVTKVQDKVNGKVHAVESDIKAMLKFDLGLDNVPASIDMKVNPSKTTMTAVVTADKDIPYNVVVNIGKDGQTFNGNPIVYYWIGENKYESVDAVKSANPAGLAAVTKMTVDISGVKVNYNIKTDYYKAGTQIATATVDIKDFIDEMNASIGSAQTGLNNLLKDVSGLQGKIDSKLAQISNMISSYTSQFLSYTDKFFGQAASLLKNPNRFLQPAMFATADADKVVMLSTEELLPTQVNAGAEVALFPTTQTGELVAPAFKKYIAVTKVSGGSVTPDQINAAVADFNKVLNGNQYNQTQALYVKSDASWKGATVEIIYEALGYNGKVAGRKYYITFK